MSSEPCRHERSDAVLSFVNAVRANVALQRRLDAITRLCAAADTAHADVTTDALRDAMTTKGAAL